MARHFTRASSESLDLSTSAGASLPLSFAALFKVDSLPSDPPQDAVISLYVSGSGSSYQLVTQNDGAFRGRHINGGTSGNATITSAVSTDTWYVCGFSIDSTISRTAFINGSSNTNATSVSAFTPDTFSVGKVVESGVTKYFDGTVEWAAIWSSSLTLAQHQAMNAGVHPLAVKPGNVIQFFDLTRNLVSRSGSALSATGTSIASNSGKVYFFPSKHRFIEGVAAAASEALTGEAATTSVGSVAATVTKALTGEAATTAVGSVAATVTKALTGEAATTAVGSVGVTVTKALTGEAATGAVGTVTTGTVDAITGEAATTAVGSVGVTVTKALTGEAATGAVGTVTPSVGAVVALTGEEATTAVGSVGVSVTKAITGAEATGAVGSITVSSGLTGRRRKTRSRRVNLWEVESPEPVQNDPALLNKLLKEMAQAQILAKKYMPERNPRYEVEMESLRTNSKALTRLIKAYRKEMDEREKEDELLLL